MHLSARPSPASPTRRVFASDAAMPGDPPQTALPQKPIVRMSSVSLIIAFAIAAAIGGTFAISISLGRFSGT